MTLYFFILLIGGIAGAFVFGVVMGVVWLGRRVAEACGRR